MELTKEMEGTESVHRRMSAPKRRKNRETGRGMEKDENGDPLSLSLVSPCLSPTSLQVHITGTFNKRRRQSHSLHFHQFRLIISRCSLPVPPHHTHIQKHPHSRTAPLWTKSLFLFVRQQKMITIVIILILISLLFN